MKSLTECPNIGKVLAEKLKLAGVDSLEKLIQNGTENTFCKLRTIDNEACINSLYAIEGAVQNIRWHNLPEERKSELKMFFNSLK